MSARAGPDITGETERDGSGVVTGFRLIEVPGRGTEDVVVDAAGAVYTGTEDGVIHRVGADGRRVDAVAATGGRPLGIELFPDGRLLICDARRGLLLADPGSGAIETLVTEVGGVPMRFCNNAAVAADGTVYFSDSSTVHPIAEWKAEMVEVTRTGRLLRRQPDGQVDVLLDGLAFANGVALAADGSFVVVAETATRTLVRRWLTGPAAGTSDLLVAELPGYPDNMARAATACSGWRSRARATRWSSACSAARCGCGAGSRGSRPVCSRPSGGRSACRRTPATGGWCTTCRWTTASTGPGSTW